MHEENSNSKWVSCAALCFAGLHRPLGPLDPSVLGPLDLHSRKVRNSEGSGASRMVDRFFIRTSPSLLQRPLFTSGGRRGRPVASNFSLPVHCACFAVTTTVELNKMYSLQIEDCYAWR
ncbi:hypothetical protein MPTK2_8g05010 [Marchantia polymorpha subsp. ruderalis]